MLTPTKISYLFSLAFISSAVGWLLAKFWPVIFGQALATPWLTAITMWLLTAALFIWTFLARLKIKPEKGKPRLDPLLAARSAALAMSASRVGSLAFGFYLGVLLENFLFSNSQSSEERVVISGVTALASLCTVLIGLWLEHLCRIPNPPADPNIAQSAS